MRSRGAASARAVLLVIMVHALSPATTESGSSEGPPTADNEELKRLRDADQADREPATIDWKVVTPRDHARLGRVKELLAADRLRTPNDYVRAALVFQHGDEAADFLLAHELCVAAVMLGKNDKEAGSLAAGAEDRFLKKMGRPQRFATQFWKTGAAPWRLYPVDEGSYDSLRRTMGVRSLAEARAYEAELNSP